MSFKGNILTKNGFCFAEISAENGVFSEIKPLSPEKDGDYILPGLIDIHIHGAVGADFSDGDLSGLAKISEYLAENGITAFAPTSMSLHEKELAKAFATALELRKNPVGARVCGIHMEGPFISAEKKGAQNGDFLQTPDFDEFLRLFEQNEKLISIADIAPELENAFDFIKKVSKISKISVSHTNADYDCAKRAFSSGCTHLTHLFNAQTGFSHRAPGVLGAASENENVTAELICDGYHVHESAVRMAFKLFPDRLALISDSLRCCGEKDGEYELSGQEIILKDGVAKLKNGVIAGSATNIFDCMKKAISFGISRENAIRAASEIPAKILGISDKKGSIELQKDADFTVCDKDFNIKAVYIGGKLWKK